MKSLLLLFGTIALILLNGCADRNPIVNQTDAGFWSGLWHGAILPFAFIISLFSDDVGIYQVPNNGGWYNFGFVLGVLWIGAGWFAGREKTRYVRVEVDRYGNEIE